jgi:hypothetical protein
VFIPKNPTTYTSCRPLLIYSFIYSFIYLLIHLFTYSFTYSFIDSFIHSFTYLFIYLFIHLFIYLLIYLFTYLFYTHTAFTCSITRVTAWLYAVIFNDLITISFLNVVPLRLLRYLVRIPARTPSTVSTPPPGIWNFRKWEPND